MGEGNFGFSIDYFGAFGPSGLGGFGLPNPFDAASGRTGVNCGLTDPEIARALQSGDLLLLRRLRQAYAGTACGYEPRLDAAIAALEGATQMGFIDSLIGGIGAVGMAIGDIFTGVVGAAPTIVQGVQSVQNAINTIQGDPVMSVTVNPNTGSPMTGAASAQMQFAMACNADPTGQCQAAIRAALSGMGSNPITGSPMMPGVNQAGVVGSLGSLATRAAMDPRLRALLSAFGIGGAIAVGEAAVGAITGGGSAMVPQGPLLIPWPPNTPYPRGIVLRADDKPEKRYRSEGAALLRSGDVAAVRRVAKAASRARRGRGRRSSSRPTVMMLPGGTANVCGSCLTAPCGCK